MASSPASQSAGKPKQMSSRLATMKFMQRAAASAPSSPLTPSGAARSGISTPNSPPDDGPPSKRFKSSRLSDAQDVLNSPGVKESPRQGNSMRYGNGSETKWAFAVRHDVVVPESGFRIEILSGRHSDVSEDDEPGDSAMEKSQGRKVFGKKKHTPSKQETADNTDSDNSGDSDASEDSEDSLDRQARQILGRSNRLSGATNIERIQCYNCKDFGHLSRNCPSRETSQRQHPRMRQKG